MSVHQPVPRLRRRRLGVVHLVFFTVAASAPLTVLGGGVTTTFAVTGVTGVPLSFLVLAVALGLFAVGYAAMSRYVANAGAFYSYLAHGIGPKSAVSGSFVALISYNAIQIGLYGLFGSGLADFLFSMFGVKLPWWTLALVALLTVGALGVLRVDLNARVLAVLLFAEIVVVALYDIGAFTHPAAEGITLAGLRPEDLFVQNAGAVFAISVAGFIGFESAAIYSEECRNPRVTVARATFVSLAFTGLYYALSAWAMTVTTGTGALQEAATQNGPGLVFGALAEHWGDTVALTGNMLFLTSVFAALLSFHNGVARYAFALGREHVLPARFARVGAASGGPVVGSLAQSTLAIIALTVVVVTGLQPVLEMFTWFSGMAALGVIVLMAGTSVAVVGFFRKHREEASLWHRAIAPSLAAVVLLAIAALLVGNFDALVGTTPDSPLRWILPGLVLLAAVLGGIWGAVLKRNRPEAYAKIGHTALQPEASEARIKLSAPPR
jgi:amino acid transporter